MIRLAATAPPLVECETSRCHVDRDGERKIALEIIRYHRLLGLPAGNAWLFLDQVRTPKPTAWSTPCRLILPAHLSGAGSGA
jgi:hypothetical protein